MKIVCLPLSPRNGAAGLWDVGSCRLALITLVVSTLLIACYGVTTVEMPAEPSKGNDLAANSSANGTLVKPKHIANYLLQNAGRPTVPKPEIDGNEGRRSFTNLRQARVFGLLGTNFSLAYNLTVGAGNTLGNITVVAAPAPTYYYVPAPAPYYAYGYAYPYGYYNPYAYNPYNYNPYASYYYG